MSAMPRAITYTIAAFAVVAIGLPLLMVVVKASIGIIALVVAGGVAAYVLYAGTQFVIDKLHDA